jgi:hypothetical protein
MTNVAARMREVAVVDIRPDALTCYGWRGPAGPAGCPVLDGTVSRAWLCGFRRVADG